MFVVKPPNPFLAHQVDDAVTLPPGHVPKLHAPVLARIEELLPQSRQADKGVGLLVIGQTGSGKSHMIAQLRQQLAKEPSVVLVAIKMNGAYAGRFWTHARKELVSELLRSYADPTDGANGLLRLLRNQFPEWATGVSNSSGGLWDWMFGKPGTAGKGDLRPHLDEYHKSCPLDYNLRKVLPKVSDPNVTTQAHDWLKGEPLGSDDLQALGIASATATDQQHEVESRAVVLSLLKLAGKETTMLLCFDQVETIQAGTFDSAALRQFTTLVTEVVVQTGHRVVATFLRSGLHTDIVKAIGESDLQSNLDKMGQFSVTIPTLTWEQSVQIVAARLDASPACHTTRQFHPNDPFWPLSKEFAEATFQENKLVLSPRHLIRACAVEFEYVAKHGKPSEKALPSKSGNPPAVAKPADTAKPSANGQATKPEPAPVPPPDPEDDFIGAWNKRFKKWLQKANAIKFDEVMGIGLPWLVEATGRPFTQGHDKNPNIGDVNLVFRPAMNGTKSLGVSLCNQEPKVLRWRLERLLKQWSDAKGAILGSLVVLRYAEPKPTAAALERINKLVQAGARVLFLSTQQLAEIATFQELLTAAHDGKLSRAGKPVEVTEYTAWVKCNLTDSVADLLCQMFDHPASGTASAASSAVPSAPATPKPPAKAAAKTHAKK